MTAIGRTTEEYRASWVSVGNTKADLLNVEALQLDQAVSEEHDVPDFYRLGVIIKLAALVDLPPWQTPSVHRDTVHLDIALARDPESNSQSVWVDRGKGRSAFIPVPGRAELLP